jgi:hypothetical protein
MKTFSIVLFSLAALLLVVAVAFGYLGIGMMGVCFLLFGVAFYTIADLQRRVAAFPVRQQNGSPPTRAPGAFPIVLFCIALAGIVGGITYRQAGFFGSAIYFTLFGILFWRISLVSAQVSGISSETTTRPNQSPEPTAGRRDVRL